MHQFPLAFTIGVIQFVKSVNTHERQSRLRHVQTPENAAVEIMIFNNLILIKNIRNSIVEFTLLDIIIAILILVIIDL